MAKSTKTLRTRSAKAGISFPVGRVHKLLKNGNYARRIGVGAAIYLAAVLEYLMAEILELAADAATQNNRNTINPRHIMYAIRKDEELNRMMLGSCFATSGVIPGINQALLPKKTMKDTTA